MRFMIIVKASAQSETSDCEIEVRQLFELTGFAPGEAVDRFRAMGTGEG